MHKSLEFALFRSYGIPSISQVLDRSGQFRLHGQRRYDDTALLLAEIVENGYESPRGKRAISTINRLHGKHSIGNDDMLYVLSTFAFEPMEWAERYGWRPLNEIEKRANYHFWFEVGTRMKIYDIPQTIEAFARFKSAYERANCVFHPANRRVAEAAIAVLQSWYPCVAHRLVRWAVYALLNDELRQAFYFPKAPFLVKRGLHAGLLLAAKVMRFMLPRRQPYLLTHQKHRSYPSGYQIENMGPPTDS